MNTYKISETPTLIPTEGTFIQIAQYPEIPVNPELDLEKRTVFVDEVSKNGFMAGGHWFPKSRTEVLLSRNSETERVYF